VTAPVKLLKKEALLIASYPLYACLFRRYGLNIKSVHREPDEIPGI